MGSLRFKVVYLALLPAIVVAACILGYYTYQTAAQLRQLGEKSIAHSLILLVEDKVKELEGLVIAADNAVFATVDLTEPETMASRWKPAAKETSPSVRAVVALNAAEKVVGFAARASARDARKFRRILMRYIVPDLRLDMLPYNRLKHLHRAYRGKTYLISYKAVRHRGQRYYLVAHHDTGHLIRNVFPELFTTESGKQLYNVVDESNQRVFGPNLAQAGDYVVGHRFPTTLYGWRLQVAPKEAPLLHSKQRTSRFNQAALVGLSLGIILLGTIFILFAADKERRLNALKSDFIANVSHELKTPLSVIRMFGELLLTGRTRHPEKQQTYLETICSESERLSGLIENVLDFAVLERGKPQYQMQDCDLSEVVVRAIETISHRFERKGARIYVSQIGDDLQVRVDEQAILLAVMNLLDNAVKYGAATPVHVTVESLKNEVQVRVRDGGPGIPNSDLRRIFERFYRGRGNPKARGTGIGLTLVKQIVQQHRGRAWAENARDGGALVGFAIPRSQKASALVTSGLPRDQSEAGDIRSLPQGAS